MGADPLIDPLLVLCPIGRDGPVAADILRNAGLPAEVVEAFPEGGYADTGGLLVAEEAFDRGDARPLFDWLTHQPPWSDYPIILLRNRSGPTTEETRRFIESLGQVTILERPLHPITVVSAVKSALRARARQREAEAYLLERLRAAEALRESEGRFRTMADTAPALIWTSDEAGRVIYANHEHEAVFGQPPGAFLGEGWLDYVHEADRAAVTAAWRAAVASQQHVSLEYRIINRAGDTLWVRCKAAPRRADGRFVGHIASGLDITETKLSAEQLERRVEARTAELAAANRQLVAEIAERETLEATLLKMQRLEAVGQLTAGVAHDFNNLLQVILGSLGLLRKTEDPAQVTKRLDMMRTAAERGAMLTRQLLAFSRRQKLEPKVVDLNEAIEALRDLLQSTLGGGLDLSIQLADKLWPALVDPTQIEMIVLNLAINARDAMQVGGKITVSTSNVSVRKPRARPEAPAPGDYVLVAVSDTGSGMPAEVLERVFEPFFTTKPVGKGSGLGLSQVLGFAKQSGGGVEIDTQPGQGTTVKVYLPRARQPAAALRPSLLADGLRASAQGGTILIVDDDELVRETTAEMLRGLGYQVLQAGSGGAALELLAGRRRIDLMIVDFAMPGMNGVEVAKVAASKRPDMAVLFVTGYADHSALTEVAEGRILSKPFTEAELARRIVDVLQPEPESAPG